MPPVVLLTDFGVSDPFVGQMKGVLSSLAPDIPVLDLSHGIHPFQVLQAGWYLLVSAPYYPRDSVFLAVVDPGVGTSRNIVLMQTQDRWFLAPDNGLLSFLLQSDPSPKTWIMHTDWSMREPSPTFHGRDVFAPLGARLAAGTSPNELGTPVSPEKLVRLRLGTPRIESNQLIAGALHIDQFGNVILNLPRDEWWPRVSTLPSLQMISPAKTHLSPATSFARIPAGNAGILPGSQGFLELALNQKSASSKFRISVGDLIVFTYPETIDP
ncbi:MAG: SAM hydrolase/SAM-dependent halogenase family protein [Desulfovibrionales bacterium]